MNDKLSRLHGILTPFLAWIGFAVVFCAFIKLLPAEIADINSARILEVFQKYAPYAGIVIGLLAFLSMLILMGLTVLFRIKKSRFFMPIILILGFFPWMIFGGQLVFREPRYANLAKAIISFLGEPMLYASAAMVGFGLFWLATQFFTRSK